MLSSLSKSLFPAGAGRSTNRTIFYFEKIEHLSDVSALILPNFQSFIESSGRWIIQVECKREVRELLKNLKKK